MRRVIRTIGARDAWRIWAASYDREPNPLLALEQRLAAPLLGSLNGARVIDLCAGTGRWTSIVTSMRGRAIGLDISPEMLGCAAAKPGLGGRLAVGDLMHVPFANESADLAICSFGLSYVRSAQLAFREMARVARRVMVSDMHPDALRAGWSRSFERPGRKFVIGHYSRSLADIDSAASEAGLRSEFNIEACFGEPERAVFAFAGKEGRFEDVRTINAIFVKTWI